MLSHDCPFLLISLLLLTLLFQAISAESTSGADTKAIEATTDNLIDLEIESQGSKNPQK